MNVRIAKNEGSRFFSRLFSDENLTKKAYLNAVAGGLDYTARLLVGFMLTPLLVAGLGNFYFGTWQVLLRLVGSISPASGRATQALKFTLATHQKTSDFEQKRRYVASALTVCALFLPLLAGLGAILIWFVPLWIKAPAETHIYVRMAAGLLVLHLIMTSLATVPQSVLEGENLGYKRMGLSTSLVFLGGGITYLALHLRTGIIGVSAATLITTLLTGAFFLPVMRKYTPWFGLEKPTLESLREFLGLSGWFLAWNLIMNVMTAMDVVLLGRLGSVESVTGYSLTKYAPETLITIVAIVVFGISPGLGGIIGSGDHEKAARLRGEIMSITWLVVTVLGSTALLWNRTFIRLWVGREHYLGSGLTLLIVVVVFQFILIRNDSNIIDLTLRLREKVLFGISSILLSLLAAVVSMSYLGLGIYGLCLGIITGRVLLSVGYPVLVSRYFNIAKQRASMIARLRELGLSREALKPYAGTSCEKENINWRKYAEENRSGVTVCSQLKPVTRAILVTIILFATTCWLDNTSLLENWIKVDGWFSFVPWVGVTVSILILLAFHAGLTNVQRSYIIIRVQMLLGRLH